MTTPSEEPAVIEMPPSLPKVYDGSTENSVASAGSEPSAPVEPESEQRVEVAKTNPLTLLRVIFDSPELFEHNAPIDAYVLPRTDAHNSEYLCERDFRVQHISGFSGTNAYVVVTRHLALLWTDARYFIQAAAQLAPDWTLMRQGKDGTVAPEDWLAQNMQPGDRIAFDPALFKHSSAISLIDKLSACSLVPIQRNLVDLIWTDRPAPTANKLIHLSVEDCGEEPKAKLHRVAEAMKRERCDLLIVSQLDEIAWLFNLRGSDIPFNPVFFSYAVVTHTEKAYLFVDLAKMSSEVAAHLKANGVNIFAYDDIHAFITQYHEAAKQNGADKHKVWLPDSLNYALGSLIARANAHADTPSPVCKMKAVKNAAELEGMRRSHIRDSAALVKFFFWLRNEVELGHLVDECRAAKQCRYYREQLEQYVSLSFETISAVDEHAALPHYHMDEESGKKLIAKDSVFLLDSGGQYRDGTTDVTRTVCYSETPDAEFCRMYTLVLKAHIACALQKFPEGTNGMNLDGVTRSTLWQHGYDFGHGVGHGVGHFLNVHENPPYIGYRVMHRDNLLRKGQVATIEPGFYAEGRFGIRIENCYELVAANVESGVTDYITFAPLTYVPIQKGLIVRELLNADEVAWLNRYHNRCLETVGRYLQERKMQNEYNYLAELCTPLAN